MLDAGSEWEKEHGAFSDAEIEAARRRVANEVVATAHTRSA